MQSATKIERFHVPPPSQEDSLQQKFYEECRALQYHRRSAELLQNDEVMDIFALMDKHATHIEGDQEAMVDYINFKKVRDSCKSNPRAAPFFKPTVFFNMVRDDPYGRIAVRDFYNYVTRKVWLTQARLGLSVYDVTGQGFLRETDFENYIQELIPTLTQLKSLEPSFQYFYLCTVVRKFFFFLDPLHTGKIRIHDILCSTFLDDLLELREADLTKTAQEANWFSAVSALKVYGDYLNLDKDMNGMLSKTELLSYGKHMLTEVFIDHVFQECLTYHGELDFKVYLDFVLAMENLKEPAAVQYIFRILDFRKLGYLDAFALHYFYKGIEQQAALLAQVPVPFSDVKDEIFDMVRPKDPLRITPKDLIASGCAETILSMLIDVNGFLTYENRESFIGAAPGVSSPPVVISTTTSTDVEIFDTEDKSE